MTGADSTDAFAELLGPVPLGGADAIVRVDSDGRMSVSLDGERAESPVVYDVRGGVARRLFAEMDCDLPGAPLLADRAAVARACGVEERRIRDVALVAYRPRRRAVLRVLKHGGACFVKLLTKKVYRRARERLATLPRAEGALAVCSPSRWLDRDCAYVAPAAEGASMHEALRAGADLRVERVVAGLTEFADLGSTCELTIRPTDAERSSALAMLTRAVGLVPALDAVIDLVDRADLPDWRRSDLVHTDLHDKQLFLSRHGIGLIDLDGVCRGDKRNDFVNLIEHVRLRGLQLCNPELEDTAARLAGALSLDLDECRAVRGVVRARLAAVYALRTRWSDVSRRLRREAVELLS